jgi:hypothetical protein
MKKVAQDMKSGNKNLFNIPYKSIILFSLVLFSTTIYAYEYKAYNLYDGEFNVIFPTKPTIINPMGVDTYTAIIKEKRLIFTVNKLPSPLGDNIGGYNKLALDEGIKDSFRPISNLISFNATLDKQKGLYTFLVAYSQSGNESGSTLYTFEKRIVTNSSMYSWRLTSPTMGNKKIFDQYKNFCTTKK